ncbi:zf-TFIIB domain-containing protein [Qipengyuania sp. MTN3-11]|uniref:TFIIB-type zinc ribbon-containing protein n=1 Tax=Qipengyuania sp. MTN3-11 TaxID=3056557 RepID=UPI0036F1D3A4
MRTEAQVAAMPCPVCQVPLAMSDRQGIEIDYCPQCRGIWLDRGELDKIVERSAAQAPAPRGRPQPSYAQHGGHGHAGYGHGYGKPHKRKKSFLEELFD